MSTNTQAPILWQNDEQTVTLIDIPRSIAHAQDISGALQDKFLLSTEPLQTLYPTNEPKSAAAKAKLVNNTVDAELHELYANLLSKGLAEVGSKYHQPWCSPRPYIAGRPPHNKKSKLDSEGDSRDLSTDNPHPAAENVDHKDLPSEILVSAASKGLVGFSSLQSSEPSDPTPEQLTLPNPNDPPSTFNFRIPPTSSFVLGNCSNSRAFHQAVRTQAQNQETGRTFDFILLDPPWPNKSVKRTHKTAKSTYSTLTTLWDIQELIAGMDLDMLMAEECLVGVWITNKPAARELVLGDFGLFDCWGIELEEEWLWLKTTVASEPVMPLGSVWRKPYEVLLLGRKRSSYAPGDIHRDRQEVKRRVLISVPDLHSRKPCLKELIAPLMRGPSNYRALEVFARHLVAGWWSWGDECIKFNWSGYWQVNRGMRQIQSASPLA